MRRNPAWGRRGIARFYLRAGGDAALFNTMPQFWWGQYLKRQEREVEIGLEGGGIADLDTSTTGGAAVFDGLAANFCSTGDDRTRGDASFSGRYGESSTAPFRAVFW